MRPLLASTLILVLVLGADAAAPPAPLRPADQLDYLFLASNRPVLIRLHVRVGDKPYGAMRDEFLDKLFDRFDKDRDGSLSPAEVARLPMPNAILVHAQGAYGADGRVVPFAEIDTNKDGRVSREELRSYYGRNGLGGLNFSMQTAQATEAKQVNDAIIKRLDPKGDGKLTAAKVARMYEKFRSLDENEDEIITPDELTNKGGGGGLYTVPFSIVGRFADNMPGLDDALQEVRPGREDGLVKALMTKYDRNKDGKLSLAEIGLDEATFARFDADKDGSLGPAELKAFLTTSAPDLALRVRLGSATPPKGLLGRLNLAALLPTAPVLTLLNEKTIDPSLKKKYRRGPGDSMAIELGDTNLSLQLPHATDSNRGRVDGVKGYHLQLYDQKAGKKGHVTRADLAGPNFQNLLAIFSQADRDADGKLTRAELVSWLDFLGTAQDVNLTLTCNDLGRSLFDVLDGDRDGRLSLREMRSAWKRLGPLAKGGSVGQDDLPRTMRIDISWSGQSVGSLPVAVEIGRNIPPRPMGRANAPVWFRKMDKNNDGDISPREWLGTDEDFQAIDADGDGLISAAEAIAFEDKKRKTKDKP